MTNEVMPKQKGRPRTYNGKVREHIVTLISRYGLSGARRRLNADHNPEVWEKGTTMTDAEFQEFLDEQAKLRSQRSLTLVPEALNISMPTLTKIKNEAGIELQAGRPTEEQVAKMEAVGKKHTYKEAS